MAPGGDATIAPSVGGLLRACVLDAREARALLALTMSVPREWLVTHAEAPVEAADGARFAELAGRRALGVPMAYLLGEQEFHSQTLRVTPDVLIPRPETELLVDTALSELAQMSHARVLELGTGSGCIAIALALARPGWRIVATDLSERALEVARGNCRRHGVDIALVRADWFAPIEGRFDLVVSNPPYVALGDPHLADLAFEPQAALSDGADGLSHLRTIVSGARDHLLPGGRLLVEHGHDQGTAVRELAGKAGFKSAVTLRDLAGIERACLARTAEGRG